MNIVHTYTQAQRGALSQSKSILACITNAYGTGRHRRGELSFFWQENDVKGKVVLIVMKAKYLM